MDRAEPPEPPESEPEPPPPAEPPEPPTAKAPKPRTPATVLIAITLLWLLAILTAWVATVSAVATSFEVSARYADAWSPLEFVEPALIATVAVLCGLLAVKLRSGRDWARHVTVITTAIALAAAILTGVGLDPGTGTAGTLLFTLLLFLLLMRPARDWCDTDAPRHSPKIDTAAQPPHQVVVSLFVLWTATGIALYVGSTGLLALAGDEADLAEEGSAWAAGAVMLLAIVHAALNIAFSFHRNWARWATLALAAIYAAWLIVAAILYLIEDGTNRWLVVALLGLVPLVLVASLATADARTWCRRNTPDNEAEN